MQSRQDDEKRKKIRHLDPREFKLEVQLVGDPRRGVNFI